MLTVAKILLKLPVSYNLDLKNKMIQSRLEDLGTWMEAQGIDDFGPVYLRIVETFTPTAANPFPWIPEFKAALVPAGGSEREANAAYALLERRSHIYKDAVVEDAAVQAGLDAIGGWQEFCNRTEDQNPWLRKAFVKAFIQARESGYHREPRVYRGLADRCEPVIIGNEERCRIAYQSYRMPQEQIESATHRAIAGAIAHLPAVEA